MAYRTVDELESLEHRNFKSNHRRDKEYVRTFEFAKYFSDFLAKSVLGSLCDRDAMRVNDATEALLRGFHAINGGESRDDLLKDIQFGAANAVADILTAARAGCLPEMKNNLNGGVTRRDDENPLGRTRQPPLVATDPRDDPCHRKYVPPKRSMTLLRQKVQDRKSKAINTP